MSGNVNGCVALKWRSQAAISSREYIGGETNFGEATFRQLFQDTAMFTALEDDRATSTTRHWKIVFPNGKTQTFEGWVKKRGVPSAEFDGVLEVETVIRATGAVTWS